MRHSFGDFVLDTDMRELQRGSQALHLSPKAFQLLEILVASRPSAVSKTDLQERLWPNTFVVEKNLSNLIGEIRDALGDDPSEPQFIRTVHRFGYAFRDPSGKPNRIHGERAARFRVVWLDGRATLGEGEYVLGRDPDLELFLDSPSVSRRHALLRICGAQATVEDLGSKNGTFVRDRRIDCLTRLDDGDVIRVGSVNVSVQVIRISGSTETISSRRH
jgi:DNA-binding winged helix-turn-helix (wHTH) protein